MKKTIISLVVLSALSVSAHAMTVKQANDNVAIAEHDYSEAQANYNSAAYNSGSGVINSGAEKMLASAGAARAQAYADQRAAVEDAQNKQDTADKAEVIAERDAKVAAARLNSPSATANRKQDWNMTPGITKESNPEGHPTHQVDPMDSSHWTQTPSVIKESNPAGHPTHQIAPATHIDSSLADRQAAKAAAKAAMAQHKTELSNYGTKQSGTATYSEPARAVSYSGPTTRPNTGATHTLQSGVKNDPTGTPTNQQSAEMGNNLTQANVARTRQQAVALADARQAETDRQAKTLGKATHRTNEVHEQPLHQSVTATPAVDRSVHLDSATADKTAAAKAQADAQAQHAKDIANYGVKRVATATYSEQPHTVTYSGVSIRPNTGATINVSANSLKPDTKVQVTDATGHKSVVKASTLTPSTQVSIPFHSAFQHAVKGGNSHDAAASHADHGTGTGADNAHDHAFGGHVGAGGGFHM